MGPKFLKISPASMAAVPPQVAAAQEYLRFAEVVRNPPPRFDGQVTSEGRDLSQREQTVYDAALEVLRAYFTGEKDYAIVERETEPPKGDDPKAPIPSGSL